MNTTRFLLILFCVLAISYFSAEAQTHQPLHYHQHVKVTLPQTAVSPQTKVAVHSMGQCHSPSPGLADPVCTPTAMRTYDKNEICGQSTKQFRPPVAYTNAWKIQLIKDYGYTDTNPKHYELDHYAPIEAGGAGYDPQNYWPMPYAGEWGARVKDRFENYLKRQICSDQITPAEAQRQIHENWIKYYIAAGKP